MQSNTSILNSSIRRNEVQLERSTTPAQEDGRSRFNAALSRLGSWPKGERDFFIAVFSSNKDSYQLAAEMGLNRTQYAARNRRVLRRFMHDAKI